MSHISDTRPPFPSPDRKTSWRAEKERKLAKLQELRERKEKRKKEILEREVWFLISLMLLSCKNISC